MVGNGIGAKNGILFKTAVSLEETGKIDILGTVFFYHVCHGYQSYETMVLCKKQRRLDQVIAGVLPEGKEAVIRSLQKKGKVAMVGDGISVTSCEMTLCS